MGKSDQVSEEAAVSRESSNPLPDVLSELFKGHRDLRLGTVRLRTIGSFRQSLLLAHVDPPYALFLFPDESGVPALLTKTRCAELVREGVAEVLPSSMLAHEPLDPTEKLSVQMDLLDAAGVANGTKSIQIWLHRNWTPDLRQRRGDHDNAHTIRRWRARRNRGPG